MIAGEAKMIDMLRSSNTFVIGLPDYIYQDQDYIDIKIKRGSKRETNEKTKKEKQKKTLSKHSIQNESINESDDNITVILDCVTEKDKYIKEFKDKTLVFPAGIKHITLKGVERIDCNLDFSKAVDIESLNLVNPSYTSYSYGRYVSHTSNFRMITNWPPNMEYLHLEEYEHPLDNLPNRLQYLKVPVNFNYSLDNLPASLLELEFAYGCKFAYALDSLPHGLKKLTLTQGMCYSHPLEYLPSSIEILDLGCDMYKSLNNLPDSITHLTVGCVEEPIARLPANLKVLKVWYDTMMYLTSITDYLEETVFPDCFETLKISYEYESIPEEEKEKFQKIFGKKKININICYCD